MVNIGLLAAEIGPVVWGHPSKFQRASILGSVTIFGRAAIMLGIEPDSRIILKHHFREPEVEVIHGVKWRHNTISMLWGNRLGIISVCLPVSVRTASCEWSYLL